MTSRYAASLELQDAYQKVVEDSESEIENSLLAELKQAVQGVFNKSSPAILSSVPRRFQFRDQNTPKRNHDEDSPQSPEQFSGKYSVAPANQREVQQQD